MKDLQIRFGIVLLVIVSIVSFMLGRSMKPFLEERAGKTAAVEPSGGDENTPESGFSSQLAALAGSGCVSCHLDEAHLKASAAGGKKAKSALQSGAG